VTRKRAVIVGAGLGGLATSIRLAHAGLDVTVLEKNPTTGGRCSRLEVAGHRFDTGPTMLLMRDAVEELFSAVGRRLDDYVSLERMHTNYRIHFGVDGTSLDVTSDPEELAHNLDLFSPGAVPGFKRFLADAGYKYRVARARFVERNFTSIAQFATLPNLYYLLRTNTLRSLAAHAGRYFPDPRLQAAFTFQSMYLGLSPAISPAVYALLPYTEIAEGIWFPKGGMYALTQALERLALELGVGVRTDQEVEAVTVRGSRARAVRVAGEDVPADVVVSNADLPYTYRRLLPQDQPRRRFVSSRSLRHGCSVYLLFVAAPREFPQARHHTVFLSSDVSANYRAVFADRRLPADPSLYVCVASRTDRSLSPNGQDGVYTLVPVPEQTAGICWSSAAPELRQKVLARLQLLGFGDLGRSPMEMQTPEYLAAQYNLSRGAAFGLAHNFTQVGYFRPSNRHRSITNVYFVGASTVPGGGVPMVIIGSRLTAERVLMDLAHG